MLHAAEAFLQAPPPFLQRNKSWLIGSSKAKVICGDAKCPAPHLVIAGIKSINDRSQFETR
jgi:hypothetical protein